MESDADREWREICGEAERRDEALAELLEQEPHPIVVAGSGGTIIVHPSTRRRGWWQASYFGEDGEPWSHDDAATWHALLKKMNREWVDWPHAKPARPRAMRNPRVDACETIAGVPRSIVTEKELGRLRDVKQERQPFYKPEGIWYSFDNKWARWLQLNRPKVLKATRRIYEITVDLRSMVVLADRDDLREFSRDYAVRITGLGDDFYLADWAKVAREHSGIELQFSPKGTLSKPSLWIETWDVPSGCIWDMDAIISLVRVAKVRKGDLMSCDFWASERSR